MPRSTRSPGRPARLLAIAFVVLTVAQLLAMYWPRVDVQGPVEDSDKIVHAAAFGLPVFVGMLAWPRRGWLIALLFLVHAPVSELLQYAVLPGRSGDPKDALADGVGVALGAIAARLVGRRRRAEPI